MVVIERASREDQLKDIASMMRHFTNWAITTFHADDDLPPNVFDKLEAELENLPGRFAPPKGTLLLATDNGRPLGCIGGAPLDDRRIEASRLWVEPATRGKNAGQFLVTNLVNHARTEGFQEIVLRSHLKMTSAHRLYQAAGFSKDNASKHFDDLQPFEIAMALPLNTAA